MHHSNNATVFLGNIHWRCPKCQNYRQSRMFLISEHSCRSVARSTFRGALFGAYRAALSVNDRALVLTGFVQRQNQFLAYTVCNPNTFTVVINIFTYTRTPNLPK